MPDTPREPLDWDALPALFPEFPGSDRWLPLLQHHARLVEAAAPRVRLTAVAPEDAVRRQYAESLELLRVAAEMPDGPLADVGSGGGYPGLVAAATYPDRKVHLVEPLQKRARFLAEAAEELGLANVTVHPQRAEEAGRGALRDACALVTARAVSDLRVLLEYTAPLARPGGLLALAKGSGVAAELEDAANALQALGCDPPTVVAMRPDVNHLASVVLVPKAAPTPDTYPRRPGAPEKRPL